MRLVLDGKMTTSSGSFEQRHLRCGCQHFVSGVKQATRVFSSHSFLPLLSHSTAASFWGNLSENETRCRSTSIKCYCEAGMKSMKCFSTSHSQGQMTSAVTLSLCGAKQTSFQFWGNLSQTLRTSSFSAMQCLRKVWQRSVKLFLSFHHNKQSIRDGPV